jgi:hypothetical protein
MSLLSVFRKNKHESSASSSACASAPMAAMPVAKQIVDTPSSIWFTLSSSAETVGLPCRP